MPATQNHSDMHLSQWGPESGVWGHLHHECIWWKSRPSLILDKIDLILTLLCSFSRSKRLMASVICFPADCNMTWSSWGGSMIWCSSSLMLKRSLRFDSFGGSWSRSGFLSKTWNTNNLIRRNYYRNPSLSKTTIHKEIIVLVVTWEFIGISPKVERNYPM